MKILDYGRNSVCFKDYVTLSGATIFLETERNIPGEMSFIARYGLDMIANATADFNGKDIKLRIFSAGCAKCLDFKTARTMLEDMEGIVSDQQVIQELAKKEPRTTS
jgi:hypothetical protein